MYENYTSQISQHKHHEPKKKKNLRLYPPLIIIIIIIIIKFSKKASNLSKRMRLPPTKIEDLHSQKKKKKKIEDLGAVVQS